MRGGGGDRWRNMVQYNIIASVGIVLKEMCFKYELHITEKQSY